MLKKVLLNEFFSIEPAVQDDKINFDSASINDLDSYPFLSRSARNNGISSYVVGPQNKINKGNIITLALDGSTGATFFQYHDFFSGQNIWLLRPKGEKIPKFDIKIALYLITSIRKAVNAYTYNLSLTKTRLNNIKLYLPLCENDILDIEFIEEKMSSIKHIKLLDEILDERYQI